MRVSPFSLFLSLARTEQHKTPQTPQRPQINCEQAACGYLTRYDFAYEEQMPEMEREAWELAARLSSRDCDDCHGGGMTETAVELNIEVPEGMRHVVGEHPTVSAKVICPCVVRTMEAGAGAPKSGTY